MKVEQRHFVEKCDFVNFFAKLVINLQAFKRYDKELMLLPSI